MRGAGSVVRGPWTVAGRAAALAIALAHMATSIATSAAQDAAKTPWEISPYRIHVALAADSARRPEADLEFAVRRAVIERVDAGLRPWWALDMHVADDAATRRQCLDPRELAWDDLPPERNAFDKLLWLSVAAVPTGYDVTCREFDVLTRRWGRVVQREAPQRVMLGDACFRALAEAFTPLARIETTDDDARAELRMKGGALPRPPAADLLVAPGDPFLPLVRRTRRGPSAANDSQAVVPWTYLLAAEEIDGGWLADVVTALRRPLAAPRRGGAERIAVGLRQPATPAKVRFFARSNREQPLARYEVFRQPADGGAATRIGVTGRNGVIEVPRGERATTTLLLRSDGQVLARLVVASGAADVIEAPIADDAIRLAAQAEVQAVREELIDLVARRAIMIARVKGLLQSKKFDDARVLMSELNELPTPSTFASRIDAARDRLPTSDDPRVRQTVDGLFSSTKELLGRFLDVRAVANLQAEVNEAARGGT